MLTAERAAGVASGRRGQGLPHFRHSQFQTVLGATQQSLQDQGHQPTCMKTCFKKFRKHQIERGIWEKKEWETADGTPRWETREVPGTTADIHTAACEGPHNGADGYWQRNYSLWRTYTWAEEMCEEEGVANWNWYMLTKTLPILHTLHCLGLGVRSQEWSWAWEGGKNALFWCLPLCFLLLDSVIKYLF